MTVAEHQVLYRVLRDHRVDFAAVRPAQYAHLRSVQAESGPLGVAVWVDAWLTTGALRARP